MNLKTKSSIQKNAIFLLIIYLVGNSFFGIFHKHSAEFELIKELEHCGINAEVDSFDKVKNCSHASHINQQNETCLKCEYYKTSYTSPKLTFFEPNFTIVIKSFFCRNPQFGLSVILLFTNKGPPQIA